MPSEWPEIVEDVKRWAQEGRRELASETTVEAPLRWLEDLHLEHRAQKKLIERLVKTTNPPSRSRIRHYTGGVGQFPKTWPLCGTGISAGVVGLKLQPGLRMTDDPRMVTCTRCQRLLVLLTEGPHAEP